MGKISLKREFLSTIKRSLTTLGNTEKGDAFAATELVRSLIGVLKEKEILVPDDLEKIIIDAKSEIPDSSNPNYDEAKKQIDSML